MTGTFIHHTLLVFLLSLIVARGQFFPPPPTVQTVVKSQLRQGVIISYKEVRYQYQAWEISHLTSVRLSSAKPRPGCEHGVDMFTSLPMTLVPMRLIPSFGSFKQEMIPPMSL